MCSPSHLADRYLTTLIVHLGLHAEPLDPADPSAEILVNDAGLKIHLGNHAPSDPEYLRLACHLTLDHPYEHITAAALRATRQLKAVKATPHVDGVTLAIEMFTGAPDALPTIGHLTAVVPRALRCLRHAVDEFTSDLTFRMLTADFTDAPVPDAWAANSATCLEED